MTSLVQGEGRASRSSVRNSSSGHTLWIRPCGNKIRVSTGSPWFESRTAGLTFPNRSARTFQDTGWMQDPSTTGPAATKALLRQGLSTGSGRPNLSHGRDLLLPLHRLTVGRTLRCHLTTVLRDVVDSSVAFLARMADNGFQGSFDFPCWDTLDKEQITSRLI